MANIVPGALWHPIDVTGRAARRKGRGLIGHIAVTNSTLLLPGPLATRPSDWHFFLPKQPYPTGERFAQLIDLDLQSWSSADANATCPAFESEGGVGTDVNGLWTDNQVESAAIILAHLHRTEGVPLQDMANSLPTSRGFGVHRYGIDPYRVAGGEKWSSVYAKACPGDNRLKQVGAVVARAQQIANGDDMPTLDEIGALIDAKLRPIYDTLTPGISGVKLNGDVWAKVSAAADQLTGNNAGTLNHDLRSWCDANGKGIAQIATKVSQVQAPAVDPQALADALVADTQAVATLADALAAAIAKRLGNG